MADRLRRARAALADHVAVVRRDSISKRRNAMEKSGITGAPFAVYGTLLMIEKLPADRRPRTLRELAGRCGVSNATLTRALAYLGERGWIARTRGGGKDNPTRIEAVIGKALPPRPQGKTNADYCRAYRLRKRAASRESEPQTTDESEPQTTDADGAQSAPRDRSISSVVRPVLAGQSAAGTTYSSGISHSSNPSDVPGPAMAKDDGSSLAIDLPHTDRSGWACRSDLGGGISGGGYEPPGSAADDAHGERPRQSVAAEVEGGAPTLLRARAERRERVRSLFADGLTPREIAERTGETASWIGRWTNDMQPPEPVRRALVRSLFADGVTPHEIRERTGEALSWIGRWTKDIRPEQPGGQQEETR